MNMALLARQIGAGRQKLRIIRTMRAMTAHTILAGWRVLPQEWSAFFGVALVTGGIDGATDQHLVAFAAVRIVTRGAADLHISMF